MDSASQPAAESSSGEVGGPAPTPPGPREPRLVRRVVCAYRRESLPGAWLQTWRRLDRLLQREGYKIKATLEPLDQLPEDTDILVVPPELRDDAREAAPPGVPLLVTPPEAAPDAFAALVRRLQAGTDLIAERIDPTEQAGPKIVTYRGSTRLD